MVVRTAGLDERDGTGQQSPVTAHDTIDERCEISH